MSNKISFLILIFNLFQCFLFVLKYHSIFILFNHIKFQNYQINLFFLKYHLTIKKYLEKPDPISLLN